MEVEIGLFLDVDFYELEEWKQALAASEASRSCVYTWKTSGTNNWMDRGASRVDALGLVLLPAGLPDYIDMPDDAEREDEQESC